MGRLSLIFCVGQMQYKDQVKEGGEMSESGGVKKKEGNVWKKGYI